MILLGLGLLRYYTAAEAQAAHYLWLFGFILTNGYIFYLQKRMGVSRKILRIQTAVFVISIGAGGYFINFG
ncbi:hypothetical protein ACQCVE_01110 [Metabacillus sp. 113a]|uniref:hypothetical protein n=1 Tax=Metabacillus sp. 113a TaxID=3404706 RepID=UPI003CF3C68B